MVRAAHVMSLQLSMFQFGCAQSHLAKRFLPLGAKELDAKPVIF